MNGAPRVDGSIWPFWALVCQPNGLNLCAATRFHWTSRIRKDLRTLRLEPICQSACQKAFHRLRYDRFLVSIGIPAHFRLIIRSILLLFWLRMVMKRLSWFPLCISLTREQDICVVLRYRKFGQCRIECNMAVLWTPICVLFGEQIK
jgi:hypothetical protein